MSEGAAKLFGFVVVDKRYRLSSTSVVTVVKSRLRAGGQPKGIKVGHCGTLDPLASGVLVVAVGGATKLVERVMGGVKEYEAQVDLSRVSPTDDLEAEATAVEVGRVPERAEVEAVLRERFTGVIQQTPPAHSAVKIGGQRAYTLARAGEATPIAAKAVRIDAIEIRGYAWPMLEIAVTCGRGTYIRSLARDVGVALGVGGVLTGLRRTRVGPFEVERARTLEELPDPMGAGELWVPEEFSGAAPGD